MSRNVLRYLLSATFLLLLTAGCSEGDERKHPLYQKGVRAHSSGKGGEAAENFRKLLQRRPSAVYTHLKLATVYDELLNQPLLAVLHYQLYLAANPDAPDTEEVKSWLQQAEKRCYEDLKKRFEPQTAVKPEPAVPPAPEPAQPEKTAMAVVPEKTTPPATDNPTEQTPTDAAAQSTGTISNTAATDNAAPTAAVDNTLAEENAKLKQLLEQYKARYAMMQRELKKLRKAQNIQPTATAEAAAPATPATSSGGIRTYKVQAGDTPGKIARKIYGRSSLYTVIMRANPNVNERKLRPGMILNIPAINTDKK